jgi:hypothetical protein
MAIVPRQDLGTVLEELAAALDIPPGKYRAAVERFTAVGNWLDAVNSPLKRYRPRVFPQGSFRLGTVVRPVARGREADYDIDLVCCLDAAQSGLEPRELKHLIGNRLKENATYREMLDKEGRRCWTLNYAESDGIGFHLDALPSVPGGRAAIQALVQLGVEFGFAQHALDITERRAENAYIWLPGGSNPRGYAEWFDRVNLAARVRVAPLQKQRLFEANRAIYASVDQVPDGLVRSPLQRAIQLLKRHRDVRFAGHPLEDEKPISMIITTLTARAYQGELDVALALAAILERMDDFATSGIIEKRQDRWYIANPVNPAENFADRWNEPGSRRADAFFQWVAWARQDLALAEDQPSEERARVVLAESFGGLPSGSRRLQRSGAPITVLADDVPGLANSSHCQAPRWPIRAHHRVSVVGSVRRELRSAKELWRLTDRTVPKDFAIRFEAKSNATPAYDVKWQVVNTGAEATAAGTLQLRGGFDDGEGQFGVVRWESTRYRGTHWIEAFVIKDGLCVARSGPTYVRIR